MGNIRRYFEKNLVYFVTTATKDRHPILNDSKLCRILLVTIEYYKTIFDYSVLAYCLMPDHIHLILQPRGSFELSFIMKMIKGSFSRTVNKLNGKEGSLWQRRYYDEIIRNEDQLSKQIEYIHYNPIKAGLESHPGKFPHSSFTQYNGKKSNGDVLLAVDLLG